MTSRAALLPFPGDPFLLNYWLNLFEKHWYGEIDALYIGLNSPIEFSVVQYIMARIAKSREMTGKKIVFDYVPNQADHGPTINRLLDFVTEELVMLVEDDGFIFRSGMVDLCFRQIEEGTYDIVGSKRGSCAMEILTAARDRWGLAYEGEGDHGPNFWPNFFFTSKDMLLATDRNFAAKAWYRGDTVTGLDYQITDEVAYGDTFVNTSLQLRGLIPQDRILCIPQYHGHPDDVKHAEENKYLFDGKACWTHIGSLSSGVGGLLRDMHNRPLVRRLLDPEQPKTVLEKAWCQTDFEKREFERRVQWWLTFWETQSTDGFSQPMKEFYDLYGNAVLEIIKQYELSLKHIKQRQQIYSERLGL
jgi:hypothetical protein